MPLSRPSSAIFACRAIEKHPALVVHPRRDAEGHLRFDESSQPRARGGASQTVSLGRRPRAPRGRPFISFDSSLCALFMPSLTLACMSDTATTTSPAWPASRSSPRSLRSVRLIPPTAWPANEAEQRTTAARGKEETASDGGRRKERVHETGCQTHAATEDTSDTGRRLMLLDDLDFAVRPTFHHGRGQRC